MPSLLLVATVALSLAELLLIANDAANLPNSGSDSDNFKLNLEMQRVEHYVCMGCQSGRVAGKALFFAEYKSAACHYPCSSACNRMHWGICLVTI